jgi:hypothetical protein
LEFFVASTRIFYHSATEREKGKEEHAFFIGFLEFTPLLSKREER